jgi:5-bromo-4-chloroindolyl phosphate hydrolysis protein
VFSTAPPSTRYFNTCAIYVLLLIYFVAAGTFLTKNFLRYNFSIFYISVPQPYLNIMTFIETLLIASIPSTISAVISYRIFRQQMVSYKRETMAERTAQHFLEHKTFTDRSFETLRKHLGGWDSDHDELRRILVRAGAIRTFRGDEEWWTLLSRLDERIQNIKSRKE